MNWARINSSDYVRGMWNVCVKNTVGGWVNCGWVLGKRYEQLLLTY